MEARADYLFEVSWEVCNKVGGIYTVVTSKIHPMLKFYKENYYAVGPYLESSTKSEFKEKVPPQIFKEIFEKLHSIGIMCYFGSWRIDGEPNVILVDYRNYSYRNNEIKARLWEKFGIDSLNSQYHDYDEPILWSTCVGIFLEEFASRSPGKKIVGHFHEWLAGGGLLHLKGNNVKVATVFTTHATMLGRTLAGNHIDLYMELEKTNPEERAYQFGIQDKFLTEKACAKHADVFTTVSEITGIEATHFLGKKPDCLLPNGLDIERFPTFEESSIKHKLYK
ncbi:MAG: alpha-glucan family phosphorylase, partial [Nanoarchaeota archaeon]|nr:alpha-glucan family phosphorylase [Nanoarchaeota archaeon]